MREIRGLASALAAIVAERLAMREITGLALAETVGSVRKYAASLPGLVAVAVAVTVGIVTRRSCTIVRNIVFS